MNLAELVRDKYNILIGEVIDQPQINKKDRSLVINILIQGDGWACNFGDYNMLENYRCAQLLYDLMEVLNINSLSELKGKAVRIAVQNAEEPVTIIGNVVYDKWFNFTDYIVNNNENEEPVIEDTEQEETTEE